MSYGYCEHCGSGPVCAVCGRDDGRRTPIPTRAVYAELEPYPTPEFAAVPYYQCREVSEEHAALITGVPAPYCWDRLREMVEGELRRDT